MLRENYTYPYTQDYKYCDGFGVSYATTSQNTRYIRYERCYSTVGYGFGVSYATTFQIHGTKQPNCWKTGATGNATVGEDVFYSRHKHSI
jgi:hypothetical protein